MWRGAGLTVSAAVGPCRRSCSGNDGCWMTMGWLSRTLSAQKVWWSVLFLPFLDVVPSPAPPGLAPRLLHRHDVRGITLAAPRPRQMATRRLSRQPVRRLHPPARGVQRQACTYGVDGSLAPVWGEELGGRAGILLACAGGGENARV